MSVELPIRELRIGDSFVHNGTLHYTVWEPPKMVLNEWHVRVQYADGGLSIRVFPLDATLPIERADA